jgi:hypothetical protein
MSLLRFHVLVRTRLSTTVHPSPSTFQKHTLYFCGPKAGDHIYSLPQHYLAESRTMPRYYIQTLSQHYLARVREGEVVKIDPAIAASVKTASSLMERLKRVK